MTRQEGAPLIESKAKTLPAHPGVYRMIDNKGKALYIGKARRLNKRVLQYAQSGRHSSRIAQMIRLTRDMEFTLTDSEAEALLLEAQLIKKLRPPFNVVMRDDKSFPLIQLSHHHQAPRLSKYRDQPSRQRDPLCEYFGPFVSAYAVDRTLTTLQQAFLLRSCSDHIYAHRQRPCLLYQIKRCSAPCTQEISLKDYGKLAQQARAFLKGDSRQIQKNLTRQMEACAKAEDFERAAIYRDRLHALHKIQNQKQHNLSPKINMDLFAIYRKAGASSIQLFIIRNGQNLGNHAWFPKHHKQDSTDQILSAFIAQFYDRHHIPSLILVNEPLAESALLAQAFTIKAGRKITLTQPKRGFKKDMMDNAVHNANQALARHHAELVSQKQMAKLLAHQLNLKKTPQRIEIYDNSHIQGTSCVGAMVVAGLDGFMKPHYRVFNIDMKDITPGDDYAMMRQVFTRRFGRSFGQSGQNPIIPDLIIIDGGLGQINAVKPILSALGENQPPIMGMAKGPARSSAQIQERFIFANKSFELEANNPLLYYLQRLRDEAHRFAITQHRQRRKKTILHNPLDDIVGIGATHKKNLLARFGSAKAVARTSARELSLVEGIGHKKAKRIYDHFHSDI